MSKHSGENTLLQIFRKIEEKDKYLKGLIDAKQEPFIVTATVDFQSSVLTNVSHTFAEITEAYERGDHVFLVADISQMIPGQVYIIPATGFNPAQGVMFEQLSEISNIPTHIGFVILADNSSQFRMDQLSTNQSMGGLKFVLSDTVPTVDDRSIITFVRE